jgi:low molecular weight protein-tyrosine phosphatase
MCYDLTNRFARLMIGTYECSTILSDWRLRTAELSRCFFDEGKNEPMIGLPSRHYGGRRALVRHFFSCAQVRLPWWRRFHRVDWPRVERLVFVCKGNICRSPYALARASAIGIPADSIGLEAASGEPADDAARRHAAARGLSLDAHRTKPAHELVLGVGDLLVCMEPVQLIAVRRRFTGFAGQLTLLGLWSRPYRPSIFDPFGLSDEFWPHCLDVIDDGVRHIADQYRAAHEDAIRRSRAAAPGERTPEYKPCSADCRPSSAVQV